MSPNLAVGYDCHVEVSFRTGVERLAAYLKRPNHLGAVLIQVAEDFAARRNMLEALQHPAPSRGIVRLVAEDATRDVAHLDREGVRGALLDIRDTGSPWAELDRIQATSDRLPAHWHIELAVPWFAAARWASCLARMPRDFCLRLRGEPSNWTCHDEGRMRWWLEMGNAYLKVLPPKDETCVHSTLMRMAQAVPDRVVLGSGWPEHEVVLGGDDSLDALWTVASGNAQHLYRF